jgi:hypothetical protein
MNPTSVSGRHLPISAPRARESSGQKEAHPHQHDESSPAEEQTTPVIALLVVPDITRAIKMDLKNDTSVVKTTVLQGGMHAIPNYAWRGTSCSTEVYVQEWVSPEGVPLPATKQ